MPNFNVVAHLVRPAECAHADIQTDINFAGFVKEPGHYL